MFQVDNYTVRFRRCGLGDYVGPEFKRLTRCIIDNSASGDIVVGVARCSIRDQFCRDTGRKVALANALKNGKFSRAERQNFWDAYHSMCNRIPMIDTTVTNATAG